MMKKWYEFFLNLDYFFHLTLESQESVKVSQQIVIYVFHDIDAIMSRTRFHSRCNKIRNKAGYTTNK